MKEIETKVKICRGSLDGISFVNIYVGGESSSPDVHYASRILTGAVDVHNQGVFTSLDGCDWTQVEMSCGEHNKVFKWLPIDIIQTPAPILWEALRFRIAEVRDWVRSLDHEEILNFSFPVELGVAYSPPRTE